MPFFVTAIVGSLIVLVIDEFFANVSNYHVAPLFLVPLIWAPLLLKNRIHLLPSHYALFVSAVLLHNMGAFGWYQQFPLGFSFDILVHFYFAFVASFLIHRLLRLSFPFKPWQTSLFTLFVIMGCGALHEIMEFATLLLGQHAMLNKKTSYIYDTERDLTNNLLGVTAGLIVINLWRLLRRRTATPEASSEAGPYRAG
jgi:uncharacterized membrane protein YjdF